MAKMPEWKITVKGLDCPSGSCTIFEEFWNDGMVARQIIANRFGVPVENVTFQAVEEVA